MSADSSTTRGRQFLVPLVGETPQHVAGLAEAARTWLRHYDGPESWRMLALTLAHRAASRPWPFRSTALVADREELLAALDSLLSVGPSAGQDHANRFAGNLLDDAPVSAGARGKLAFVVGGGGAQWPGMGNSLRADLAAFRGAVDDCAAALARHASWSLHGELDAAPAASRLDDVEVAVMSTFAISVALGRLLRSWGVVPDAVAGHCMGEIISAHLAGVLTLEDATRVTYHWAALQRELPRPGRMLVVGLPVDEVGAILGEHRARVSIGAINSPRSTTLSGDAEVLSGLQAQLTARGVFCRLVRISSAYHGHEQEPLREALCAALAPIAPRAPATAIYSTVQAAAGPPSFDVEHWWRGLRHTIDLAGAIRRLADDGTRVFWELGPHPTLASSITECLEAQGRDALILGTLRRGEDELTSVLRSVGDFYGHGGELDWRALYGGASDPRALPADVEARALPRPGGAALQIQTVLAAPREARSELLLSALLAEAADRLGVPRSALSADRSWIDLGLESLHAVQLRSYLQKQFRLVVPLARFFSGESIAEFVLPLVRELERQHTAGTTVTTSTIRTPGASGPVGLTGLTAADVNDLPAVVVHELLARLVDECSGDELADLLERARRQP